MARQIFAAEVSHENMPLYIRDKFSGNDDAVRACINTLRTSFDEVFVLSTDTCFIVYVVSDTIDVLLNFFLQDPKHMRFVSFYKNTEASSNHLFATASGLCSIIKGDRQILTQIKEAYELASECGSLGVVLDNLIRDAIRVGKKVRKETQIEKFSSVIVESAFALVYDKLINIYERNFLIIGTGQVARLALQHLHQEGISNVVLASYNIVEAVELASRYNATAICIHKVISCLADADVIIGENHEMLMAVESWSDSALRLRSETLKMKSHILLDFGMPKSFTKKLQDISSIELFNTSSFKTMEAPSPDALNRLDKAWKLVSAEAGEFFILMQQLERAPILTTYLSRLVSAQSNASNKCYPNLGRLKTSNAIDKLVPKSIVVLGDTHPGMHLEIVKKLRGFNQIKINFSLN